MNLESLLSKLGLTYEELSSEEKETFRQWSEQLNSNPLTVDDIKFFIKRLKDIVSNELVDAPEYEYILIFRIPNRKHVLLKARLRNLLLIEGFLEGKERAKKVLEAQLEKRVGKS
jgi:uridine kinase